MTLFGKTGLNENSVVSIFNALIMHYNVLIMILNAFVTLLNPLKNVDNVQQMFKNG